MDIQKKLDEVSVDLEKLREENKTKDFKVQTLYAKVKSISSQIENMRNNHEEVLLEAEKREQNIKNQSSAEISKLKTMIQSKEV
jgi:chromosome segregation ATPase